MHAIVSEASSDHVLRLTIQIWHGLIHIIIIITIIIYIFKCTMYKIHTRAIYKPHAARALTKNCENENKTLLNRLYFSCNT